MRSRSGWIINTRLQGVKKEKARTNPGLVKRSLFFVSDRQVLGFPHRLAHILFETFQYLLVRISFFNGLADGGACDRLRTFAYPRKLWINGRFLQVFFGDFRSKRPG